MKLVFISFLTALAAIAGTVIAAPHPTNNQAQPSRHQSQTPPPPYHQSPTPAHPPGTSLLVYQSSCPIQDAINSNRGVVNLAGHLAQANNNNMGYWGRRRFRKMAAKHNTLLQSLLTMQQRHQHVQCRAMEDDHATAEEYYFRGQVADCQLRWVIQRGPGVTPRTSRPCLIS